MKNLLFIHLLYDKLTPSATYACADGKVHQEYQETLKNKFWSLGKLYGVQMEIGQQTHREVGKLWEEKRKKFVLGAKYFLMAATKHLAKFLEAWLALTNVNYHRNV